MTEVENNQEWRKVTLLSPSFVVWSRVAAAKSRASSLCWLRRDSDQLTTWLVDTLGNKWSLYECALVTWTGVCQGLQCPRIMGVEKPFHIRLGVTAKPSSSLPLAQAEMMTVHSESIYCTLCLLHDCGTYPDGSCTDNPTMISSPRSLFSCV